MAKFAEDPDVSLEQVEEEGKILIKGKVSIEFQEHEIDAKWELKVDIVDKKNDDEVVASFSKTYTPKKATVNESFKAKLDSDKFKRDLSEMNVGFKFAITHVE